MTVYLFLQENWPIKYLEYCSMKSRKPLSRKMFSFGIGPSCLTEAALAKHNESQEEESGNKPMVDVLSETDKLSVTAKTMNSWASNWTECTNNSFGKVLRYYKSNSALHKEVSVKVLYSCWTLRGTNRSWTICSIYPCIENGPKCWISKVKMLQLITLRDVSSTALDIPGDQMDPSWFPLIWIIFSSVKKLLCLYTFLMRRTC